jgi:DNA-binding transcriptional regulator LsrR (DeoR family)
MASTRTIDDPRTPAALQAANLYYLQDLTMDAIAAELRTSRSSVSRLLTYARESGLVEITVHSPLDHGSHLEDEVRRRFKVSAHVVPMPDGVSEIDRLERVAMAAGRIIPSFIDSNMIVGLAWGSTLSAISRHVIARETHNTVVVQMNGAGSTMSNGIEYASEILQRFATALSAQSQQFPVPAFFDDPATKAAFWRERSTRRTLDLINKMDVAIFGLGSPFAEVPSHVYIGGYLDRADYASLSRDKVVGDIATVFYRADGSWRDIELNARATGPDFSRLKRVARRVCVVSGPQKLPSLRGALATGLVTDLIMDAALAQALVES